MAQPNGKGKRGRKPTNEWTFKTADETEIKVTVSIPPIESFPLEKQREFAIAGLRQNASSAFRKEYKGLEGAISTNQKAVADIVAAFKPTPEQLAMFLKDKPIAFPTHWAYPLDAKVETEEETETVETEEMEETE
jgi:hypothetical protein